MQTACTVIFLKKNCFWDLIHCPHHQSPSSLYHPLLNLRKLVGNPGVESSCTKVINKYRYVLYKAQFWNFLYVTFLKSWSFVILVSNTRNILQTHFPKMVPTFVSSHRFCAPHNKQSDYITICARGSEEINYQYQLKCSVSLTINRWWLTAKILISDWKKIMIINTEIKLYTSNCTNDVVTMNNVKFRNNI